jgi:hypothetical protein
MAVKSPKAFGSVFELDQRLLRRIKSHGAKITFGLASFIPK